MSQWNAGDELTADNLNKNRAFPSKVRAHLSAYQDLPELTDTFVEFDSEDFDLGSEFDTATHKFIAGKDGYYSIRGSIGIDKGSVDVGKFTVNIIKNGGLATSNFFITIPEGSYLYYGSILFMDTVSLVIGDTIEIQIYAYNSSESILPGAGSYLEISRVYET